jgi:adenylyltransferase/sulfurtransferase
VSLTNHSRSVLAGYDPPRLFAARVLVAGLGALGQNVLQSLALSGVGSFLLIDCDGFEDHNATRSPFFPHPTERALFAGRKAPIVAHRAAAIATAPEPAILFCDDTVQRVGDAAIRWADVVVSAVDSLTTRAWLTERARLYGKPLVEGGFGGSEFNFSAFSGAPDEVCYRCFHPGRESSASCTQYAREAERNQIIPAIQATAAVLGGYLAEQVISILHGKTAAYGLRFFGDVRRPALEKSSIQLNPECPGEHVPLPVREVLPVRPAGRRLAHVLDDLREHVPSGWVAFAEPVVISQTCTNCGAMCRVRAPESSWLLDPRCARCGGSWPTTDESAPSLVSMIELAADLDPNTADLDAAELGLSPGGGIVVYPEDGSPFLAEIPGQFTGGWSRVPDTDVAAPKPA